MVIGVLSLFYTLFYIILSSVCWRACVVLIVEFQNGEEGFLRDLYAADLFHAFLALLLFFEELAFAGYVATVALGGYIFADGFDGFAGNDFGAYGSLHGHVELLARYQLFEFHTHLATNGLGIVDVGEGREGIDTLAIEEDIGLDEAAGTIAYGVVVERGVAAAYALELVVEIEDNLGQGHIEVEFYAVGGYVILTSLYATFLEAELHDGAYIFALGNDLSFDIGFLNTVYYSGFWKSRGGVDLHHLAFFRESLIGYVGHRGNDAHIKLTLQTFLYNLQMEETQETATEAEAEGHGALGGVG